jgi:hypothetical protein
MLRLSVHEANPDSLVERLRPVILLCKDEYVVSISRRIREVGWTWTSADTRSINPPGSYENFHRRRVPGNIVVTRARVKQGCPDFACLVVGDAATPFVRALEL